VKHQVLAAMFKGKEDPKFLKKPDMAVQLIDKRSVTTD
jgi:hypothetical protein